MHLEEELGEWYPLLSHVFATEWMQKLGRRLFVAENVVPEQKHWFRAFRLCPPSEVKVVIIGQDPYINGEADGLSFSSYGKMTPSLEVVFDEINRTQVDSCKRTQTHLDDWTEQGVLLLNSVLTTRMGKSRAHQDWGWENFTMTIMRALAKFPQPIVFLSWGKDAQKIVKPAEIVGYGPRLHLKTYHPQAQNYNPTNKFVGCNHFVEANLFLIKHGLSPIWWADPKSFSPNGYDKLVLKLQNHMRDAKIDCPEVVYSYPAISNRPHPFDPGLGSKHAEDLPF